MKTEVTNYPNLGITTRVVFDIDGHILEHEWYEYSGPVAEVKGGASRAEQAAADQQRQAQTNLMQQQLNMQMGQLNAVNQTVDPMIAKGGLAPGVENAMTSLVMNQLPQTFNNMQGQINNSLVQRGITGGQMGAGSGDVARNYGQLGAMQAAMQQQGLGNIQLDKQNALMQDLALKMNVGQQYGQNTGLFNSGAQGALNSGVTAANNADQAATGLWGAAISGLTGLAGSAVGKGGIFGKG
jgi:hypothetical protein